MKRTSLMLGITLLLASPLSLVHAQDEGSSTATEELSQDTPITPDSPPPMMPGMPPMMQGKGMMQECGMAPMMQGQGMPPMMQGMMPDMPQGMMPGMMKGQGMPPMMQGMMQGHGMPPMMQGMMQQRRGQGMMPHMGRGMMQGMGRGMGHGMMRQGRGMSPMMGGRGMLSEGSSVEVNVYDGNPEEGGALIHSMSHVVGEEHDMADMPDMDMPQLMMEAGYIEINISEQVKTLALSEAPKGALKRLGRAISQDLNDDSSVSVSFYDGDPAEEGASETSNFSLVIGVDSERAFMNAITEAAEEAAYAVVTISPQTQSIDVAAMKERMFERFAPHHRPDHDHDSDTEQ